MVELGLPDWPELKAKLSTNDIEEVKECLRSYLVTNRLVIEAKQQYMCGVGGSNLRWVNADRNRTKAYAKLAALL
jgi:hypothetical protein